MAAHSDVTAYLTSNYREDRKPIGRQKNAHLYQTQKISQTKETTTAIILKWLRGINNPQFESSYKTTDGDLF